MLSVRQQLKRSRKYAVLNTVACANQVPYNEPPFCCQERVSQSSCSTDGLGTSCAFQHEFPHFKDLSWVFGLTKGGRSHVNLRPFSNIQTPNAVSPKPKIQRPTPWTRLEGIEHVSDNLSLSSLYAHTHIHTDMYVYTYIYRYIYEIFMYTYTDMIWLLFLVLSAVPEAFSN